MKRKNTTRSALFTSIISLLLCVSMLVGTTFAWFTDEVKSGVNTIAAGNLDIELEYAVLNDDGSVKEWKTVNGATDLFTGNLWEPGHTEVVYLKLSNLGTLALKYNLGINIASEKGGINVAGNPFKLSDHIYMGVVENAAPTFVSREKAIEEAQKGANGIIGNGYAKSGSMTADAEDLYMAVVVYMPTTIGNEANYKTGTNRPEINLGINLFATQLEAESDSFGTDYDKDAVWTGNADTTWYNTTDSEFVLTSTEDLAGLATIVNSGADTFANKKIYLDADIDLNNVNWTPIGTKSAEGEKAFTRTFAGSFYGQGHTISNLRVVGGNALGLFGRTGTGTHIEGLIIDGAYISGTDYVGAIAGYAYLSANCIKNCTVQNATIIATPYIMDNGEYDGGAKAGVIVGYALNGNLIGNTVKNSTVTAYRDLGAIAGMLNDDGIGDRTLDAFDNTIEEITLNYIGVAGKYADDKPNQNMDDVVGRLGAKASVGNNTIGSIEKNDANKGATMIFTLEELIAFAKEVNAGNTYAGKTVILGADIDLANMEWTPIGTGDGFNGIFDGNGHTISNLKITGNKSTVGLFANTNNGEIKNLTVKNASVSGRLNVGVVAGNPYTSKYTNITVKGHVEVNGMSYVGGVGGKNAYANWTDITVSVDETSYVKAVSTENGTAYRTYVGGVVGFNGEGGHTFKNITSNIDVIGDVCDIGGIFGIAHYSNVFENITCTGNVTNLISTENDGDDAATDVLETGLIAGVWHNQNNTTVSFTDISATGTISTPNVTPAGEFVNNGLVGKAYSATGTGKLYIDGKCVWPEIDQWDGTTVDTTWYNESETEFVLETGSELAGLAELVDGGETFAGKTITLDRDINLANLPFNPIGHSANGHSFQGTFDGQGYTISNLHQQSDLGAWQYEGEYYGLFAFTEGATIKNVTIADAYISSGRNEAAGVVGNAVDTTFSDITISNTTLIAYNNSAGGVAAECYGNCSFTNIVVDEDTVIGPLWGTYDVRLGGVVGLVHAGNNVTFSNITVACQLDAINDVAANYQYWLYRYSGMLIGHVDGVNGVADPTGYVTCENVKVIYGDWVNYHYCEDADLGAGSYNGPGEYKYARVEAGTGTDGIDLSACNHNDDESHNVLIVFDQLFGGGQGVSGLKTYDGVTVIYNNK